MDIGPWPMAQGQDSRDAGSRRRFSANFRALRHNRETRSRQGEKLTKHHPGRPRKFARREPNGRAERVSERLNEMAAEDRLAEQATVLNQPHRRDAVDPGSPRLVTALGRFADRARLPDELYQAGADYGELWRRLFVLEGIPGAIRDPDLDYAGDDEIVADDRRAKAVRDARQFLRRVETGAARRDSVGFCHARYLVFLRGEADLPASMWHTAASGLYVLALELGIIAPPRAPSAVDNDAIRSVSSTRALEKIT